MSKFVAAKDILREAEARPNKQSSPELSTLAGYIMGLQPLVGDELTSDAYAKLLVAAKRLAGSVLAQDQIKGQGDA